MSEEKTIRPVGPMFVFPDFSAMAGGLLSCMFGRGFNPEDDMEDIAEMLMSNLRDWQNGWRQTEVSDAEIHDANETVEE